MADYEYMLYNRETNQVVKKALTREDARSIKKTLKAKGIDVKIEQIKYTYTTHIERKEVR